MFVDLDSGESLFGGSLLDEAELAEEPVHRRYNQLHKQHGAQIWTFKQLTC